MTALDPGVNIHDTINDDLFNLGVTKLGYLIVRGNPSSVIIKRLDLTDCVRPVSPHSDTASMVCHMSSRYCLFSVVFL